VARNRKFGDLSKAARDRAARAGREYGLSRDAVRKRYNRGTYNPLARDPSKNIPREYQRRSGPGVDFPVAVDWQELALENMRARLSDYFKYNDDAVVYFTQNMSDAMARIVAMATEDELLQYASIQPDSEGNPPSIEVWNLPPGITLNDVSVYVDGKWNNIFWYH